MIMVYVRYTGRVLLAHAIQNLLYFDRNHFVLQNQKKIMMFVTIFLGDLQKFFHLKHTLIVSHAKTHACYSHSILFSYTSRKKYDFYILNKIVGYFSTGNF